MKLISLKAGFIGVATLFSVAGYSQITERARPEEWKQLVKGAKFMDRFLPMKGSQKSTCAWGAQNVLPRYIDNGIEDNIWSYWGGNIKKGEDGKYHLFVCGWLESSKKGHMEWSRSMVFNTVSDNITGPFKLQNVIGPGHNPEVFKTSDGHYVLYVIDGRYVTDNINGKWEYGKFDFDSRDRRIIEGLSNLSFARREDGSFVMVCRGGGIWISRNGLSSYCQITDKRVYPAVEGRFEDPVIWKDHVQYHMIVNDWLGRIAFYLRSKDGITWVTDPGEAYAPGIAVHENGDVEDWFKFERIKMYQDDYGRAIQANFAVIDTLKHEDKPFDSHSSKNIGIPLNPGLLIKVLNDKPINKSTKTISVEIQAEPGFNPNTDLDINSLRFGASQEVNFGRGCEVNSFEKSGDNLIVVFDAKGNGITDEEFAPKLIGKDKSGKMVFGYSRLSYVDYNESILSARAPQFEKQSNGWKCDVVVENFGQVASKKANILIEIVENGKTRTLAKSVVQPLQPYAKTNITFNKLSGIVEGEKYDLRVTLLEGKRVVSTFNLTKEI